MQESYTKRTIWIAKCPTCGEQMEQTEYKVKERFCSACNEWVPYEEQSYIGPNKF
jgi:hypothetical protein